MFSQDDITLGQVGYSVTAVGKPLCGIDLGDWKSSWVVIAYETGLGDPLFLDTDDPALPVLTAMHGEGDWRPDTVATSIEAFFACFYEFTRIAQGRESPVALESHPIKDGERTAFLRRIAEINGIESASEFWALLLG